MGVVFRDASSEEAEATYNEIADKDKQEFVNVEQHLGKTLWSCNKTWET